MAQSSTAARISTVAGTWFPVVVLVAGAIAVMVPAPFRTLGPAVNYLLALIMLGMGMTLRGTDFTVVVRRPWALVIGVVAQYVIMPSLGLALALLLQLPPALLVGVVLVGSAPGGTASNVMVYLAKGDTALSVAMTTVSTLLAPVLTPLLVLLLAGSYLPVDATGLFVSIVQIVIAPIVVGLLLRRFAPGLVERLLPWMPLVSVVGITLVVLAVVAGSAGAILSTGLLVALVVVLHNVCGLGLGYLAARLVGMDEATRRAVSIEVGMQNSGLAAGLARTHFTPESALPGALFSVWHNVSGSLLASFWSRRPARVGREDAAAPAGRS
ncbi:bile acid:sodium symporter family protein [Auraticoccus sp. F435]|uniref:Bile acid:sodium symporter family protein n=1 Tax=Auraticoccus cholistanensis TaxID=2656650 RepID=A0A6A9UUK0_9ACTN|nr:bile acid:sodium symporter family protein [Auraticoccus cholistanensis]MVA75254.1 bile acid:sodium symporter family protein [Auraticoccus cholistanensis]